MVERQLVLFGEEPGPTKKTVLREKLWIYKIPISEYHVTVEGKERVIYSRRKRKLTQKECEMIAHRIDTAQALLNSDIVANGDPGKSPLQAYVQDQKLQLVTFMIQGNLQMLPKTDLSWGPLTPIIKQAAYGQLFTERKRIQQASTASKF